MENILLSSLIVCIIVCIISCIVLMFHHISYLPGFNLKKYKERKNRLSAVCPWQCFITDGIVLLKGGALARCYKFVCPDLESSSNQSINIVAHNFNEALKQLGSGWTVQFEVQRTMTDDYPCGEFSKTAAFYIDTKRMENFKAFGKHFISTFFLTFTYELPNGITEKAKSLFFSSKGNNSDALNIVQLKQEIESFQLITSKTVQVLGNSIAITPLNSQECAAYLHSSVSLNWQDIQLPNNFMFLDHILCDQNLKTGMTLQLGNQYIPILGINDFPNYTFPAMMDSLNMALVEYRWSTRFICLDFEDAKREIDKYIKKHHGGQKSIGQYIGELALKHESTRINQSAISQENDSQSAMIELTDGSVGFGYYTSNIMVWDEKYKTAKDKAKYLAGIISSCGFTVREESFNAFEAFLSMQPGNPYANVRRPLLSTGNTSHVLPISTIWSGLANNPHTNSICGTDIPHVVCSTAYGTPFYLNLNVGDVFHTFIFGPTGAGKSTLLALLEIQWNKYKNSRVIILDKDRSARGITMAVGGSFYEPALDNIAFQPLAELDTPEQILWASEFIECLLIESNVEVNSAMRVVINTTLQTMTKNPDINFRTISYFCALIRSEYKDDKNENPLYTGLEPYTQHGQFGFIFDNGQTNLPISDWTMIEMGSLMKLTSKVVVPALMFLFRYVEKQFDSNPTLLVLDEAWLFLKNDFFKDRMQDWLKTLRKKHVACVFATQEVHDAANSSIAQTIAQQCTTKIYLADPNASTEMLKKSYMKFGLTESEIQALTNATMKRDYFYKSPLGVRMFQLDLDAFQLALISPDPEILNELTDIHGSNSGKELAYEMLCRGGFQNEVEWILNTSAT